MACACWADPGVYEPAVDPAVAYNLISWADRPAADWEAAVESLYANNVRAVTICTYRLNEYDDATDTFGTGISANSAHGYGCPGDDDIAAALDRAKELGMTVTLCPMVEVDSEGSRINYPKGIGDVWRGEISFAEQAQVNAWFVSYASYILGMAQLAHQHGADALLVGSELQGMSLDARAASHWTGLISDCRVLFAGQLGYAANWNWEYDHVAFWPQLDFIGVDAYFELVSEAQAEGLGNPDVSTLQAAWGPSLAQLQAFSAGLGRPVRFCEVGYTFLDKTTWHPWASATSAIEDRQEQLNAYRAVIRATDMQRDWLAAVCFWNWWMPGDGGPYSITSADAPAQYLCDYLQAAASGPALSWLGTSGFESDGVDPDRANHLDWYTFKVNYSGAPSAYVRLHLFRYGVEVAGSPMDTTAGAGDPATGQVFWKKRRLCKGTYTYYFSASDGASSATGDPTSETVGPVVHNRPPRLEWAGYGAWATDPVDPQARNMPGTEFTWKVKYIDREGDAPQYVRVHIARRTVNGGVQDQELAQSPFDMSAEGSDYMNGAVFTFSKTLNVESRYVCWFSAKENAPAPFTSQEAYGVPSWWRRNMVWVFNAPPQLRWAPGVNFRGDSPPDGLHPNQGNAGDTFTFKAQYRDPEGIEPAYVRLHLLKWNGSEYVEVGASPFSMSTSATDYHIADYSVAVQRNQVARARYYFSANDGGKDAIGEPSWHRMPGPIVNGTSSAQISVLTCCATAPGVQVTFTLSEDASVTAELLNIAGRLVRLLAYDKPMGAGINMLTWNGRNEKGLTVASGTYLVHLRATNASSDRSQALASVRVLR